MGEVASVGSVPHELLVLSATWLAASDLARLEVASAAGLLGRALVAAAIALQAVELYGREAPPKRAAERGESWGNVARFLALRWGSQRHRRRGVPLSAGGAYTTVVCGAGRLYAWGHGDGRLGVGCDDDEALPVAVAFPCRSSSSRSSSSSSSSSSSPLTGGPGPGVRIAAVAAGQDHTVCCSVDGRCFTFGSGWQGQLGHGEEVNQELLPRCVGALGGAAIVGCAADGNHSAVVCERGALYTFGYGQEGRLGHGDWAKQLLPKRVEALAATRVVAVEAGMEHTVALAADGGVWTFGVGNGGRLGVHADSRNQLLPLRVPGLGRRRRRGSGGGGGGGCGEGALPVPVGQRGAVLAPAAAQATAIAAGMEHTCVVCDDGSLWTFGQVRRASRARAAPPACRPHTTAHARSRLAG